MVYNIQPQQRLSETCFPSITLTLTPKIPPTHNSHVPANPYLVTLLCVPSAINLTQTSHAYGLQHPTSTAALRDLLPINHLDFDPQKYHLSHNSHVPANPYLVTLLYIPSAINLIQTSHTYGLQHPTSTVALRHLLPINHLDFDPKNTTFP